MDETNTLARLIPTLRATFDALSTTLPDDPAMRYTHALLARILATLESRDRTA